ncbi:MAG: SAM-dependent methyltransferase [Spirochaetales bacterium]|nr:SAM-dependent methyltransferase [Spirochaetales bacterium]
MSPENNFPSIADASRPNAGRIYDYLLGGNHNFEIDRQAAQQLLQVAPEMPQWFRLIRWFLGEAVRRLVDQGATHFVDFASGLPTVDHIHQIAPKGTKVIYSDIDPVTVAYAQELIKGEKNALYVECDAAEPEKLLASEQFKELFRGQTKAAIGFNGICWFLTDDKIAHALSILYEWASPGSRLFLSDVDIKAMSEASKKTLEFYKNVGQPVSVRDVETLKKLTGKWKLEPPGVLPLEDWIGLDKSSTAVGKERMGGGDLVGAILSK